MIALGSDQAGYELKQVVMRHLEKRGLSYKDYGSYSPDPVDYPVYGKKVAHAIVDGECDKGILICGTGIGISIAANKVPGIRAAVCSDCFSAEATRLHNDANILAFGARVVGPARHAGFGLGFERCVMYLTGMQNIRDVIPFPRTVNNCEL